MDIMRGQPQMIEATLPQKTTGIQKTLLTFLPLCDDDGDVTKVLLLCHPETASASHPTPSLAQRLHAEVTALRIEQRRRFSNSSFIGRASKITSAIKQAELLKNADCGYAIVGAEGTGRRHLARMIHVAGNRNESSLIMLDCRFLLPEQILETIRQLQREAKSPGAVSHQQVGTVVLSDADRCPREVQTWILQDISSEMEGIRLVAVSSTPLDLAEKNGWILPEFGHLFSTIQIELPALHHRADDISLLAQHFIEESSHSMNTSVESLSNDVEEQFRFYRWPGNVAELRAVVFEACQNSFSDVLELDDLPFAFKAGLQAQQLPQSPDQQVQSLEELMRRFETDVLIKTLEACDGNKAEAARRLGMTRPRLYRRLQTLGIDDGE